MDQKRRSTWEGISASIFHQFWWIWGGKLGGKIDQKSIQKGIEKVMKKRGHQDGKKSVLGRLKKLLRPPRFPGRGGLRIRGGPGPARFAKKYPLKTDKHTCSDTPWASGPANSFDLKYSFIPLPKLKTLGLRWKRDCGNSDFRLSF